LGVTWLSKVCPLEDLPDNSIINKDPSCLGFTNNSLLQLLGFLEFFLSPSYLAYWLTKCPVRRFYNPLGFRRIPSVSQFDPKYHPLISFSPTSELSNYPVPIPVKYLWPSSRVLYHLTLSVCFGLTCNQCLPLIGLCSSFRFWLTF
jgi:hypothetical protein